MRRLSDDETEGYWDIFQLTSRRETPRVKEHVGVLPISAGTLYRWVRAGKFPRPVVIGGIKNAWAKDEVRRWMRENLEGQRDECAEQEKKANAEAESKGAGRGAGRCGEGRDARTAGAGAGGREGGGGGAAKAASGRGRPPKCRRKTARDGGFGEDVGAVRPW